MNPNWIEVVMRWALTFLVVLTVGCSDSDDTNNVNNVNNVRDAGRDTGPDDLGASDMDAGPDEGVPPIDCANGFFDGVVTVDAEGRSGQFYSSVAFDGDSAWVVYNRPESDVVNDEAVFVARVACDGTVDVGPLQVSEPASGRRNYHAAIAARSGRVHVVWVSQPTDANPKFVKYAWFGADGTPGLLEPADVTPIGQVDPVSQTIWELDIAAYSDGAAVVASAGGAEWQVVVQRFGFDGLRDGEAFFAFPNKGVDQQVPSLAARDTGELFISWTRYVAADPVAGTPEDPQRTVYVSIPAGAREAAQTAPFPANPLSAPNPLSSFAKDPGPNGELFLAFQVQDTTSANISVRDGARFDTVQNGTAGSQGFVNFRPRVAASPDGGAVAWFRYRQSPTNNEVMIQPFKVDATGAYTMGAEAQVPIDVRAMPPNGPGLAFVKDKTYVLTWSDGPSAPETRVKLRFFLVE